MSAPSDPTLPGSGSPPTSAAAPPNLAAAAPGDRFGKFIRTQHLGAGGMGDVWKAWDTELSRWVALKFVRHSNPDDLARFRREARIAAGLTHPNIAAIYEVGDAGGQPFIAMQFVEGLTLRSISHDDPRRLATLVRDAALAVHAANERGVVHRDIKPDNLMVDAAGHLYVMDFGLARVMTVESSLSASGLALGTPAYMPPEQARGAVRETDARSDVYSLGATLFHILVGRAPFEGADAFQILAKVVDQDPPSMRLLSPKIDSDLETIVMKCLEKEPGRRYATARSLADDLDRWLSGEGITARRSGVATRVLRRVRRNRPLAAAIAMLVMVGLGAAALITVREVQSRRHAGRLKELSVLWMQVVEKKRDLRSARVPPHHGIAALEGAVRALDGLVTSHAELVEARYLKARGEMYLEDFTAAEADARAVVAASPDFAPGWSLLGVIVLERSQRLMVGPDVTGRERMARRDAMLKEATACFRQAKRGVAIAFGAGSDDTVMARVSDAMHRAYVADERPAAIRDLEEASADLRAEEYAVTLSLLDDPRRLDWLDRAVEWAPGYAWARLLRGLCRLSAGRQGVADDFDAAVRLDPRSTLALLERGRERSDRGDTDGAIADYDAALALDPRYAEIYNNRGRLRADRGDRERSLADYSEAIRLKPDFVRALSNRGFALTTARDLDGALRDFTEALRLRPDDAPSHTGRGMLRWEGGDLDGALADLDEAIRLEPALAAAYSNRGRIRTDRGDLNGALKDHNRAIALSPTRPAFFMNRGETLARADDHVGAARDFAEAVRLDPRDLRARVALGGARAMLGDLDEAIAELDAVLRQVPDDVGALLNRGTVRQKKGDFDGAIADFDEVIRLAPRSKEAYFNRGNVRVLKGELQAAIADFDVAIRLDPRKSEAFTNRGSARSRQGDNAGAIADFSEAVRLDPDHTNAYYNRGIVRRREGDHRAAFEDFDAVARREPRHVDALLNRGIARHALGDPDGAIADFTAVLGIEPRTLGALYNRGVLRGLRGDVDGAMADYDALLRLDPRHVITLNNRGALKLDHCNLDGAISDFDAVLKIEPGSMDALMNRGGAWLLKKDYRRSIADYDAVLQRDPSLVQARLYRGHARRDSGDLDGALADYGEVIRAAPSDPEAYAVRAVVYEQKGDVPGAIRDAEKAIETAPRSWPKRAAVVEWLEDLRRRK